MATSAKQLAANRRNAQSSTGPRTPDGKARSSKNATTHGLLASSVTGEAADSAPFTEQLTELLAAWSPVGRMEETLVEQIALCHWKQTKLTILELRALLRAEEVDTPSFPQVSMQDYNAMTQEERDEWWKYDYMNPENPPTALPDSGIDTYCRYARTIQHCLDRATTTLLRLQDRRTAEERERAEQEQARAAETHDAKKPNEAISSVSPPDDGSSPPLSPAHQAIHDELWRRQQEYEALTEMRKNYNPRI